jgi:hypothetical protein
MNPSTLVSPVVTPVSMHEQVVDTPLVSVVIPTYNRMRQTIAAVESVLAQTYSCIEIIVVNDGSTDGSGEALERFICEVSTDSRPTFFVSQTNQGVSAARNAGVARARGKYIAFLDSDDVWLPEKLERQVAALQRLGDQCAVCFTDARLVNGEGMDVTSFQVHRRHYQQLTGIDHGATSSLAHSFAGFWLSTILVETEALRRIGGFKADITFAEDRDLNFRLSLHTAIGYLNEPLVRLDRSPSPPGSSCRPWDDKDVQFLQQQHMMEEWLGIGQTLSPDVRRIVKRTLGALHSQQANWHLENSRYREARQAATRAVRYKSHPGTLLKFALTWLAPPLAKVVAPRTRPTGTGGHAS